MNHLVIMSFKVKIFSLIPIPIIGAILFNLLSNDKLTKEITVCVNFMLVGMLFVASYKYNKISWIFSYVVALSVLWGKVTIICAKYKELNALYLGYGFSFAGLLSLAAILLFNIIL